MLFFTFWLGVAAHKDRMAGWAFGPAKAWLLYSSTGCKIWNWQAAPLADYHTFSIPVFNTIFFFLRCQCLSWNGLSIKMKVVCCAQEPKSRPLSGPYPPFWSPLLAIYRMFWGQSDIWFWYYPRRGAPQNPTLPPLLVQCNYLIIQL